MLMNIIVLAQLAATLVVGVYFFRQMRAQSAPERAAHSGGKAQAEWKRLNALRRIRLSEPLSEQARPTRLEDIVGQGDAVEALMAVLSGPHPQHVLIYGPPGVGKTCAARLALQAAKRSEGTPFLPDAPFIEMDATCVRFDERAIADPLIGSVHDPIYQGAGQLGASGVPQPKEGAVTRAHGGVLFLDEIGELHPVQMNKLLKVLEDRVVRFESAYYDPNDSATPRWIHDVFHNGMPADFRLVGATTRAPSELPAALRSRCIEIFFRALEPEELATIAQSAAERLGFAISSAEAAHVGRYAGNGREAVNMVQMAAAVARRAGRRAIGMQDVQWVVDCGRYAPRHAPGRSSVPGVGVVNGLAVSSAGEGFLLPIEAVCAPGRGRVTIAGIVEEEELSDGRGRKIRRMSMARGAAETPLFCSKIWGIPRRPTICTSISPAARRWTALPRAWPWPSLWRRRSPMCRSPAISPSQEKSPRADGCCRWAAFAQRRGRRRRPGWSASFCLRPTRRKPWTRPFARARFPTSRKSLPWRWGRQRWTRPVRKWRSPFFRKRGFRRRKKSPPTPRRKAARRRKGKKTACPFE